MKNKPQEKTLETGFRSPCGLELSANTATLLAQGWQIRHICREAIELGDQDLLQAGARVYMHCRATLALQGLVHLHAMRTCIAMESDQRVDIHHILAIAAGPGWSPRLH